MTTGSRATDRTFLVPAHPLANGGKVPVGEYLSKTWTGGDAIKTTAPRKTAVRVQREPIRFSSHKARLAFWEWRDRERTRKRHEWLEHYHENHVARMLEKRARRKAKLLLPPMPYTMKATKDFFNPVIVKDKRYPGSPFQLASVNPANIFNTDAYYDPSQEYKVIAKLRAKTYGSGFNPGIFTAEGKQSLSMIFDSSTRLRLAIGSLIKGDVRGVAAALGTSLSTVRKIFSVRKTLSDRWLELQMGWLPLVKDLEEAGAWAAGCVSDTQPGRNKVVARRVWSVEDACPPNTNICTWSRRVTVFELQYIIYALQKSPTYMPSLATVATVAWEKLPHSYLADWVIPIGSYLEALRTSADLKGTVVKTLKTHSLYLEPRSFNPNYEHVGLTHPRLGGPRREVHTMSRSITSEISPPTPVKGFATDLSFLSWRRAVTAVALLAQRRWSAPVPKS